MLGIGASVLGWRNSGSMGGTVFFVFFAGFLCTAVLMAAASRYSIREQRWSGWLKRTVHEQLRGLMVVRAFGSRRREETKMSEKNRQWGKSILAMNRTVSLLMPVLLLIMNGALLFLSGQSAAGINEGCLLYTSDAADD